MIHRNNHDDTQRQGSVTRRGHAKRWGTTDQRLLDSHGHTEWLHQDPWRVMRIQSEFVTGFGALADLGPAISVFGSARTPADHPEYLQAEELGLKLSEKGYSVITGGGPGIMEAGMVGAGRDQSIGVSIRLPFEASANPFIAGDGKFVELGEDLVVGALGEGL